MSDQSFIRQLVETAESMLNREGQHAVHYAELTDEHFGSRAVPLTVYAEVCKHLPTIRSALGRGEDAMETVLVSAAYFGRKPKDDDEISAAVPLRRPSSEQLRDVEPSALREMLAGGVHRKARGLYRPHGTNDPLLVAAAALASIHANGTVRSFDNRLSAAEDNGLLSEKRAQRLRMGAVPTETMERLFPALSDGGEK